MFEVLPNEKLERLEAMAKQMMEVASVMEQAALIAKQAADKNLKAAQLQAAPRRRGF